MTQLGPNSTSNDTDMPNRGQLDDKECSTRWVFLPGFSSGTESTNGTANLYCVGYQDNGNYPTTAESQICTSRNSINPLQS